MIHWSCLFNSFVSGEKTPASGADTPEAILFFIIVQRSLLLEISHIRFRNVPGPLIVQAPGVRESTSHHQNVDALAGQSQPASHF